jgi:hypothetical protein
MTRIALISDIHANEVALRAVLAEVRRTGVDQIICLGDVATLGPRPNGVIEILGELGCRCIIGKHDEFLLDAKLVHIYNGAPPVVASINWTRSRLSRVELDFLPWLRAVFPRARDRQMPLRSRAISACATCGGISQAQKASR